MHGNTDSQALISWTRRSSRCLRVRAMTPKGRPFFFQNERGSDAEGYPIITLPTVSAELLLLLRSHPFGKFDLTGDAGKVGQPTIGRPKKDVDLVLVEIAVDSFFASVLFPFPDPAQGLRFRPGLGLERVE